MASVIVVMAEIIFQSHNNSMKKNIIILITALSIFFGFIPASQATPQGFSFPAKNFMDPRRTEPYQVKDKAIVHANHFTDKLIHLDKIKFLGEVNFLNSIFNRPVTMNQDVFHQALRFNSVNFNDNVSINWSRFLSLVDLYNVSFAGDLSLFHSDFAGGLKINHSSFDKAVVFQGSLQRKNLFFSNLSFYGSVDFHDVIFKGPVEMNAVNFAQGVDFSHAEFEQDLLFDAVSFQKESDFSYASFKGQVNFTQSAFSGKLNFSHVTEIAHSIDLTKLENNLAGEKIKINLVGADVSKFDFYYSDFQLYFPDETTHAQKLIVYKTLLANFKKRGYLSSYHRLYPEFRAYEYAYKGKWLANNIQKYWWNYGLNKEWVFWWIGFFILLFTLINALFFESLISRYCDIPFLKNTTSDASITMNPITRYIYYLPYALVLTFVMFFSGTIRLGITVESLKTNKLLVNIYLLIIFMVGFICVFFTFKYLVG